MIQERELSGEIIFFRVIRRKEKKRSVQIKKGDREFARRDAKIRRNPKKGA